MQPLFGNKPLKLYTPVVYNQNKIGKIHSVSKGDNVLIKLYEDNSILDVKKSQLKILPYDKGELVIYNNKYYLIKNIKIEQLHPVYELNFINSYKLEPIFISIDYISYIKEVDKKEQGKIILYLKFKDRYNQTICYLNKKTNNHFNHLEDDVNKINILMEMIFSKCKLTISHLNKIDYALKKQQTKNLEIINLTVNPFNFIAEDYQLLTYDKCEKICQEFSLNISFEIKMEKWSYDLFLREKKAIYLPKWLYESELKNFCQKNQQDFKKYLIYINKIIIDKTINGELYKTTKYLINFEKKTTDLAMDLYYDKSYDISIERIKEIIIYYEELKRKDFEIKEFTLENEQKLGVINSILNKMSIITGPPGTGKTEILLCINYVIYFLYIDNIIEKYEIKNNIVCNIELKKYLCNNIVLENNNNNNNYDKTKGVKRNLLNEEVITSNSKIRDIPYYEDIVKYLRENINVNILIGTVHDNSIDEENDFIALNFYNSDSDTDSCTENIDNITYEEENKFISPKTIGLLAPTGLAYVNMERQQLERHFNSKISGTLHRVLYNIVPNIIKHSYECTCKGICKCKGRCKCQGGCIYKFDIKLFEVDEVSMLDIFMFHDLLKVCKKFNARLILLGDVDQLPSIGPGKVLFQLIKSNLFDVTKLKEIKRQKTGCLVNNIVKMSNQIITKSDMIDDTMIFEDIDNFILHEKTINDDKIINLINHYSLDKHTKFICGFNKQTFIFNTQDLNIKLQNIFNPLNDNLEFDKIPRNCKYENGYSFRVNDKIIRTENDYNSKKMRANGEEALILGYDGRLVEIQYSGSTEVPEKISADELYENFTLNYCVTVHKSQGSQYKKVVFIIEPNNTKIKKKSLYTAISRGKEKCIIISKDIDLINCQNTKEKIDFKMSLLMEESDNYEFA